MEKPRQGELLFTSESEWKPRTTFLGSEGWTLGRFLLVPNHWNPSAWHIEDLRAGLCCFNKFSPDQTGAVRTWYPRHMWRSFWTLCEAVAFVEALRAGNREWARHLLRMPKCKACGKERSYLVDGECVDCRH